MSGVPFPIQSYEGFWLKVGTSKLGDKMRRIRALMITRRKLTSGLSNDLIAKEFGIASITVKRAIKYALKENLVQDLEQQLMADVAPLALKAIVAALQETSGTNASAVALEMLKGLGVLKKPRVDRNPEGGEGDELEYIRVSRRNASLPPNGPPSLPTVHAVQSLPAPSAAEGQENLRPLDGEFGVSAVSAVVDDGALDYHKGGEGAEDVGPVDSTLASGDGDLDEDGR